MRRALVLVGLLVLASGIVLPRLVDHDAVARPRGTIAHRVDALSELGDRRSERAIV